MENENFITSLFNNLRYYIWGSSEASTEKNKPGDATTLRGKTSQTETSPSLIAVSGKEGEIRPLPVVQEAVQKQWEASREKPNGEAFYDPSSSPISLKSYPGQESFQPSLPLNPPQFNAAEPNLQGRPREPREIPSAETLLRTPQTRASTGDALNGSTDSAVLLTESLDSEIPQTPPPSFEGKDKAKSGNSEPLNESAEVGPNPSMRPSILDDHAAIHSERFKEMLKNEEKRKEREAQIEKEKDKVEQALQSRQPLDQSEPRKIYHTLHDIGDNRDERSHPKGGPKLNNYPGQGPFQPSRSFNPTQSFNSNQYAPYTEPREIPSDETLLRTPQTRASTGDALNGSTDSAVLLTEPLNDSEIPQTPPPSFEGKDKAKSGNSEPLNESAEVGPNPSMIPSILHDHAAIHSERFKEMLKNEEKRKEREAQIEKEKDKVEQALQSRQPLDQSEPRKIYHTLHDIGDNRDERSHPKGGPKLNNYPGQGPFQPYPPLYPTQFNAAEPNLQGRPREPRNNVNTPNYINHDRDERSHPKGGEVVSFPGQGGPKPNSYTRQEPFQASRSFNPTQSFNSNQFNAAAPNLQGRPREPRNNVNTPNYINHDRDERSHPKGGEVVSFPGQGGPKPNSYTRQEPFQASRSFNPTQSFNSNQFNAAEPNLQGRPREPRNNVNTPNYINHNRDERSHPSERSSGYQRSRQLPHGGTPLQNSTTNLTASFTGASFEEIRTSFPNLPLVKKRTTEETLRLTPLIDSDILLLQPHSSLFIIQNEKQGETHVQTNLWTRQTWLRHQGWVALKDPNMDPPPGFKTFPLQFLDEGGGLRFYQPGDTYPSGPTIVNYQVMCALKRQPELLDKIQENTNGILRKELNKNPRDKNAIDNCRYAISFCGYLRDRNCYFTPKGELLFVAPNRPAEKLEPKDFELLIDFVFNEMTRLDGFGIGFKPQR